MAPIRFRICIAQLNYAHRPAASWTRWAQVSYKIKSIVLRHWNEAIFSGVAFARKPFYTLSSGNSGLKSHKVTWYHRLWRNSSRISQPCEISSHYVRLMQTLAVSWVYKSRKANFKCVSQVFNILSIPSHPQDETISRYHRRWSRRSHSGSPSLAS